MPDDSLNRIIENVARETIPRSVRMRVAISQSKRQIETRGGSSGLELDQTYLETDRGERCFDERVIIPNEPISHKCSYCDGKRCANIIFSPQEPDRQSVVTIGHGFMNEPVFGFIDAPPPYRFYHVGLIPLHEAMATAERMGREQVAQRACDLFHFRDVGPPNMKQSLVYALDEETSVPLRIAAYSNPDRVRDRMPNWVWEATTLDRVADRHFPLNSTYASFYLSKSDKGQWVSKPDLTRSLSLIHI